MPDLDEDLRATADSLLRDLDRLMRLEEEKLALDPGDARVAELAAEIEALTERTRTTSAAQRDIAEEIQREKADESAP